MDQPSELFHVHLPKTLPEALSIYEANPQAEIYAGGTAALRYQSSVIPQFAQELICIKKIPELQKISRHDRYLEFGSAVTINHLLRTARLVIPPVLAASLRQIGNYIIRNMGTIGGNLCYKPDRLNAFPVCFALNASAELRTARKSRWTSFQSFITKGGKPDIREGEIMTRIRIPLDTWDYAEFKTTNTPFGNTGTDFSFCGLANVQKQVIQDIRLVFGHVPFGVIRFRDAELQLSGRKLPINFKDIEGLQEILNTRFSQLSAPLSDVYRRLINNSFQWFLHRISYP